MAKIIAREPPLLPPIAFDGAVARLAPVIDSLADCGATHRRRVFLLPRALAAPITSLGLMEIAAQLQVDRKTPLLRKLHVTRVKLALLGQFDGESRVQYFAITPTLIAGAELSKLFRCAVALAPLLALAACASSDKPEKIIASVTPGLTETELMQRLGPPDHAFDYAGRDCFQYAIGDKDVPLAVYFDDQARVASTARAACKGRAR